MWDITELLLLNIFTYVTGVPSLTGPLSYHLRTVKWLLNFEIRKLLYSPPNLIVSTAFDIHFSAKVKSISYIIEASSFPTVQGGWMQQQRKQIYEGVASMRKWAPPCTIAEHRAHVLIADVALNMPFYSEVK